MAVGGEGEEEGRGEERLGGEGGRGEELGERVENFF